MRFKIIIAGLIAASAITTTPALAQTATSEHMISDADLQALRQDLRSTKKQILAETLTLTDSEATKFWPVYDRYIAELKNLNDSKYAMIQEYTDKFGKYDDKSAVDFIGRWVDCDVKQAQLRAKYVHEFHKALPGLKAATAVQIDRRVALLIELQQSSQLPILQLQTQVAK